jgi:PhnB protein
MNQPVPAGYHTINPSMIVKDARKAIAFYKSAFGAEEIDVMTGPDGKVMHAELRIGNSILMMGEENPAWAAFKSAETIGASPISLHLYVPDADAAFKRAIDAGAAVDMPLDDMFWGDRYGKVKDPFGYTWGIATRVKNLTPEEVRKAGQEWMAKMAGATKG